jgi:hypothetical protein
VAHRSEKRRKAENRIRSANVPVISAGVMMANMSWKTMNAWWGIVAA